MIRLPLKYCLHDKVDQQWKHKNLESSLIRETFEHVIRSEDIRLRKVEQVW